jgi:hypothetical protein
MPPEAATVPDRDGQGVVLPHLVRLLAWRELAFRFLDAHNPQPYRAIVVAHAILDWNGELGENMRHHAHHFTVQAVRIIELDDAHQQLSSACPVENWLIRWRTANL